ncbi:MAG TPA: zf-HC2 domain-containing protein [Streptosporangiaceae bacterium]|nr:zf-HC2 domain-containing protein [Streptosporangiaceae bacterium]
MTQTWDCAEARPSLGVYVLGAIDPAERGLVDAHLLTCRDCRDELAGLAGLPALLARVNPDEISRIGANDTVYAAVSDDPPEELLGTVLGLAEARRRRNRWRYLSAAAAVAAIAGGLFAGLSSATSTTVTKTVAIGFTNGTADWEIANGTNTATGVTGTVAYARQLWGDSFQVLVDNIPAGTTCQMWVVHPDGTRTEVAAWTTAADEGKVWYGGSMASSAGSLGMFQITTGNQVLLTVHPT